MKLLATADETGGRFAVLESLELRGQGPPLHVHTREDELVYVLEGLVTFHKGGQRLPCPAGTSVLLPRGCEHAYRVESGEARLLVILAPAGPEGFYRELGEVGADVERLICIAARYGVEITGAAPEDGWGDGPDATYRGGGGRGVK